MKKFTKDQTITFAIVLGILGFIYWYAHPPLKDLLVELKTSEVGFYLDMPIKGQYDEFSKKEVSSSDTLKNRRIPTKRYPIKQAKLTTGRFTWSYKWVPVTKVIAVSTKPVSRVWEDFNVVEKNSVKLRVGVSVNAQVTRDYADTFLLSYPPKDVRKNASRRDSIEDEHTAQYAVSELGPIVDKEMKNLIAATLTSEFKKRTLEECKQQSEDISAALQKKVKEFFAKQGVHINYVMLYGQFTYENKKLQEAIDKSQITQSLIKDEQEREKQELAKINGQISVRKEAERLAKAQAAVLIAEEKGRAEAAKIAMENQEGLLLQLRLQTGLIEAQAKAKYAEAFYEMAKNGTALPSYLAVSVGGNNQNGLPQIMQVNPASKAFPKVNTPKQESAVAKN